MSQTQNSKNYSIAVLPGDGIGEEVVKQALKILSNVSRKFGFKINTTHADVGGVAIDNHGKALPEETIKICQSNQAILFGSVGGPKWEHLPIDQQPERAALLPLRKILKLYANLRPVMVYDSLCNASPLKNELISGGLDILILRELTGGIYFGQPKELTDDHGIDTMIYYKHEIERIARLAFKIAMTRDKKLTSIDKANVLSTMVFWRKTVTEISKEFPEVEFQNMYVDNAAMQLVRNPKQFDLMLCSNMFGDILSDEASMITGSLGMLPSASLSETGFGLYEPIGGTAPDIQGKDLANPIAQILSLSMLLEHSLKETEAAKTIVKAVEKVLADGYRTRDIADSTTPNDKKVGTEKMGDLISQAL